MSDLSTRDRALVAFVVAEMADLYNLALEDERDFERTVSAISSEFEGLMASPMTERGH